MDKEIWRDVVGYEGLYMVSNQGRVKRVGKKSGAKVGRILKQNKSNSGYLHVNLSKDSKKTSKDVHKLVANAFLPKIDGKEQVNHKDGNRENNCVENLEWCTPSENAYHKYKVLGYRKLRASADSRRKKLDDETIKEIFMAEGTYAEIGRRFNISDVMARKIKLGICWDDVTCR